MPNMEREIQYRRSLAKEVEARRKELERERAENERKERDIEEGEEASDEEEEEDEDKEEGRHKKKEKEKSGVLPFFSHLFGGNDDDKDKKKKPKPKPRPEPEPEPEPEAKPERGGGMDERSGNENLNNPLDGTVPRRYSVDRRSTDEALRAVLDRQQGDNRELIRTVIRRYYPNFKDD